MAQTDAQIYARQESDVYSFGRRLVDVQPRGRKRTNADCWDRAPSTTRAATAFANVDRDKTVFNSVWRQKLQAQQLERVLTNVYTTALYY